MWCGCMEGIQNSHLGSKEVLMRSYLDLLSDVLKNGTPHSDRTGVGTVSVFGRQWRHNFSHGFPLLTTKRVPLRWIFEELMWFLRGDTNEKNLAAKGVDIWKEWANDEGELGPIYGKQWRNQEKVYYVKQTFLPKPETQKIGMVADLVEPKITGEYVRRCYNSNSCGTYNVINQYRVQGSGRTLEVVDVQFQNSGYIATKVSIQAMLEGSVRDPYAPNFCGVACMGDLPGVVDGEKHWALESWKGMIKRCYDPGHEAYHNYGGKGVWVCNRWLVFSNFVEDIQDIPGWEMKREYPDEYTLDKDIRGFNVYSPTTCEWVSKIEQSANRSDSAIVECVSPSGEKHQIADVKRFSDDHGLVKQSVLNCVRNRQAQHKGWRFTPIENPEGYVARYRKIDQLAKLIAGIKHTPNSRRLIVDAWNPLELQEMSLVPCHTLFQVKVIGDRFLSLHLYARSIDAFLGLPFNIASYALLTMMLAKATKLLPLELIISFGDLHIYTNHIDQVNTQMARDPFDLCEVEIDIPWGSGLDGILGCQWNNVIVEGYRHHPKIEGEVAV